MTKRKEKVALDAAPGPTPEERPLAEVVTLESAFTDLYHLTRTLGPFTDGDTVWSSEEASKELMKRFVKEIGRAHV